MGQMNLTGMSYGELQTIADREKLYLVQRTNVMIAQVAALDESLGKHALPSNTHTQDIVKIARQMARARTRLGEIHRAMLPAAKK